MNQTKKCEFFQIERSTCLRPVVVFLHSLEKGAIWVCQKHYEEQSLWDRTPSSRDEPDSPTITISWNPPRDCDASGCLLQGISHYHQGEGEPFCTECAQSLTTSLIVHIDVEVVEGDPLHASLDDRMGRNSRGGPGSSLWPRAPFHPRGFRPVQLVLRPGLCVPW